MIVYFSRWGNTEYPNDVDATTSASIVADEENYGTTKYMARMIRENAGGDLHLIQTQEPYPTDFDELRDLNHSEIAENYLPALVESNRDTSRYNTVFIGYLRISAYSYPALAVYNSGAAVCRSLGKTVGKILIFRRKSL